MLSKNQLKLITSLQQKKYRKKHGLFVVEGIKAVNELLSSKIELEHLYHTENYIPKDKLSHITIISEKELRKISTLKSPNSVLGIFKIPVEKALKSSGLTLVLDAVNDPGNLGTIIRLCDWFGITELICSNETVDCYNSKVVQATMGSLTRVNIVYTELHEFLTNTERPIYGAVMDGKNVYNKKLQEDAILIMGNEANGISKQVEQFLNIKITIPRFGELQKAESLNVATATAILLNEFRRV